MVMRANESAVIRQDSVITINKVLRNTYLLLAMTLLFSAGTAATALVMNAPPLHPLLTLGVYFVLLFLTHKSINSAMGIVWVFALTGFLGYTLGPILNMYMTNLSNGSELVMLALGGTSVIFFALSGIALVTQKNFSFMGNFLAIGVLIAFLAGLCAFFFNIPGLSLAVSAMFMMLCSGMILWQTSEIIHGGETNYLRATVTLYVSIYNIFLSLLQLLGFFGGEE